MCLHICITVLQADITPTAFIIITQRAKCKMYTIFSSQVKHITFPRHEPKLVHHFLEKTKIKQTKHQ